MEMIVLLSQEHPELPLAELKAVLSAEKASYRIKEVGEGYAVIDVQGIHYRTLGRRLAYTHEICQLITVSSDDNLEDDFKSINWKHIITGTFAVRIRKLISGGLDSQRLEAELGSIIKSENPDLGVDLENPWTLVRPVIVGKRVFISKRLVSIDKKHFNRAKPHKRPFFYPGSMSPKLARCMVNLSGVRAGDRLLDPFCGTGGILIEAGLMGLRVVGADIDWKMVQGTEENLRHYSITDFELLRSDARDLKLSEPVNAIVTDPPYGISASTAGESNEKLYREFLDTAYLNLQEDGVICMAAPHYIDLEGLMGERFNLRERYSIRMHKSLTRVIHVIDRL